uniref:Uncharacterized protein n=1 Tax=Fibrocapsa japonica TaxID=94617 RepID=A0A7S2UZS0_9STRA
MGVKPRKPLSMGTCVMTSSLLGLLLTAEAFVRPPTNFNGLKHGMGTSLDTTLYTLKHNTDQATNSLEINTQEARFNAIVGCAKESAITNEVDRRQALLQKINGFLNDGSAPSEFNDLRSALGCGKTNSDWGTVPLLQEVLEESALHENPEKMIVSVVEPWEHVGANAKNEEVRASVNLAYLAKAIGLESRVVPLWKLRCGYPSLPAEALVEGLIKNPAVFEGGHPDVYDPSSFHTDTASRDFLWLMYKRVLLARHRSQMCIFICLSHQMVASSLVELVKDAICDLSRASETVQQVVKEIEQVGNQIQVKKDFDGTEKVTAEGFKDEKFAVAPNQEKECELLEIYKFDPAKIATNFSPELEKCLDVHTKYAQENVGTQQEMMQKQLKNDDRCKIAMFHGNEVNWEAIVFANWAFSKIAKLRNESGIPAWIKNLPVGVEITSSTVDDEGSLMTEVASMRIDYSDESGKRYSSYSCQFHPELTASLSDARYEKPPAFDDLKMHHGQRMLARFFKDGL